MEASIPSVTNDGAGTITRLRKFFERRSSTPRIFILPTRYGYMFAALLLVLLLGSMNYASSLGYLLCFLLAGFVPVAMLQTHRNLTGIMLSEITAQPVFAGGSIPFSLALRQTRGWPCYGLALERLAERRKQSKTKSAKAISIATTLEVLPPDHVIAVDLLVPVSQRGRIPFGRLGIATVFPFGLFRAWMSFMTTQTGLAYPRPTGMLPLPPLTAATEGLRPYPADGQDDFHGFRPYRSGDSLRAVAWKAAARDQGMLVKKFTASGTGVVWLHWDLLTNIVDTEMKLSQLCQWILLAEQQGLRYGLSMPGLLIAPDHGERHRHYCLQHLALYRYG
jgi:uncharacterized protein (DUF58 family)